MDNYIEDFFNKFKEILDKMIIEEFDILVKRFFLIFLSYMVCVDLEWGVRGKEEGGGFMVKGLGFLVLE